MDLLTRVMFDMQQDYFTWLNAAASDSKHPAPDFSRLRSLARTYRVDSLSKIPNSWQTMIARPKAKTPQASGACSRLSGSKDDCFKADPVHKKRFRQNGHTTISALLEGHEGVEIPKHAGREACLTWALKGACHSECDRHASHVTYPRAVNQQITKLLDDCGVENPQP